MLEDEEADAVPQADVVRPVDVEGVVVVALEEAPTPY